MSSVRNQSVNLSKLVSQTDLVNQLAIHPKAVSQTVSYTVNQPGSQLGSQSASQPFSQLNSQSAISLWRFLDGNQEIRHRRPYIMHYGVLLDRKLTCCFYIQLNRFGRRIPHSLMMVTGGFTCLMVLAVGKGKFWYLNNLFVLLYCIMGVQTLSISVNRRLSFKCLSHICVLIGTYLFPCF